MHRLEPADITSPVVHGSTFPSQLASLSSRKIKCSKWKLTARVTEPHVLQSITVKLAVKSYVLPCTSLEARASQRGLGKPLTHSCPIHGLNMLKSPRMGFSCTSCCAFHHSEWLRSTPTLTDEHANNCKEQRRIKALISLSKAN